MTFIPEGASTSPRQPTLVDSHVGNRLRELRKGCQMTQEELGKAVGLSFKQIRKYEHGENRISSSMLFGLSKALGASINSFFNQLPKSGMSELAENMTMERCNTRETEQLVAQYYRTKDQTKRTAFFKRCAGHCR